jgi:hypothetical protein
MFKRPQTYVPIAVLALLTIFIVASANQPDYEARVGSCIHQNAKTQRLETVDCSATHEAKVTAIKATESECPGRALALKLTDGSFACAVADA